jgi:hypothetical protein
MENASEGDEATYSTASVRTRPLERENGKDLFDDKFPFTQITQCLKGTVLHDLALAFARVPTDACVNQRHQSAMGSGRANAQQGM